MFNVRSKYVILPTSPNKNGGEQVWFPSSIALLCKKCSKTLRLEPGPWMSKGNPTDWRKSPTDWGEILIPFQLLDAVAPSKNMKIDGKLFWKALTCYNQSWQFKTAVHYYIPFLGMDNKMQTNKQYPFIDSLSLFDDNQHEIRMI